VSDVSRVVHTEADGDDNDDAGGNVSNFFVVHNHPDQ
jgi:hypothetical protein